MKKLGAASVLLLLLAAACPGGTPATPAEELQELALVGDEATYRAQYRYTISGDLAVAVDTTMEVAQDPPTSLRRIETATLGLDGERITISQWLVQTEDGSYSCTEYGAEGVQCNRTPAPTGMFGFAQVDEMLIAARDAEAFRAVERAEGQRVAGVDGHCFVAAPQPGTPPPVESPHVFTPTRFRFELCYSADGILLRARRQIVGEVPEEVQGRTESVLEATAVSRNVSAQDIALPGPVRDSG